MVGGEIGGEISIGMIVKEERVSDLSASGWREVHRVNR